MDWQYSAGREAILYDTSKEGRNMKRKKYYRKGLGLALSFAVVAACIMSNVITVSAEPHYQDTGDYSAENQTASQNFDEGADSNLLTKNVQAQFQGGGIDYYVSIEFGGMQFQYNYGPKWDPVSHTYQSTTSAGWNADLVTVDNSKIVVTNSSNFPVTASFGYENTFDFNQQPLPANKYAVGGVFHETLNTLKSLVQANAVDPATQPIPTLKLKSDPVSRVSGLPYYYTSDDASLSNEGTVYFALMGTPDSGLNSSLSTYSDVGTITVTIAPATSVSTGILP